ncbi:scarecrow-like protein 11 [Senna tora]|uniref:Scarecrow-like protein 11 n=1 Tax=Senna tora TaxID=362788 RepID=A0A834TKV7_9FABA|nr:scarecrow-like protein 11 [Senna tora]
MFPKDNGFMIFDDKSIDSSSLLPTDSDQSATTFSESPSSSGTTSSHGGESTEINKYSNPILRYISDILMDEEDDLQHKPCMMMQDCLASALQAAEKSFYDVLAPTNSLEQHNYAAYTTPSFDSNSSTSTYSSTYHSSCESPEVASDPFIAAATQAASSYFQPSGSREKRSHKLDDDDDDDTANEEDQGRGSKLSAPPMNSDDSELSEVFDEVLICLGGPNQFTSTSSQNGKFKLNVGKANSSKRRANKGIAIDLWTLLTQCAQAVANYDQRNANDLLKNIRQHSSPYGDGLQRLAHYFANGLETRLAASGTPSYSMSLDSINGATSADMLKAFKLYITVSPFQRISNFMANQMIMNEVVEDESSIPSLHIIDFGIYYGFQWPCLIHHLANRPGGPIKVRITGIDFPQPGFRPAERLEDTGRRLANYSKRFNVTFEYNYIVAQKWETIQVKDLKIDRSEITAVNCMYRMMNLPDETMGVDCPRDAVLKLIRKIRPNIFIHGISNGTYNAPFFVTRFKEALFHFSALFDMFEANNVVGNEDTYRVMFEKGIFGRDAINVIACEGAERVERPETYKQWQVRNQRAGFKQIHLEAERLSKAKEFVKKEYHKDFVVNEDGKWKASPIRNSLNCYRLKLLKSINKDSFHFRKIRAENSNKQSRLDPICAKAQQGDEALVSTSLPMNMEPEEGFNFLLGNGKGVVPFRTGKGNESQPNQVCVNQKVPFHGVFSPLDLFQYSTVHAHEFPRSLTDCSRRNTMSTFKANKPLHDFISRRIWAST